VYPQISPVDIPLFDSGVTFINSSSIIQAILTIVLIIVQAILINNYVTENRLSRALTSIPGAVFVLYTYTILDPYNFNIILLANLFLILSLGSLFQIYKKYQPISYLFNAGFFLGLAILFYFPYSIYLIVLIIGLYNLRTFKLREFLQIFFGMLSVIFLSGVYAYYIDLDVWSNTLMQPFTIPTFDLYDLIVWIKPLFLVLTVIIAISLSSSLKKKKKYDAIRKIELTYSMCLLGLVSIFMTSNITSQHLIIMSFPISILVGMILEQKEYYYLKEFIFLLLIGFFVAISYGYLNIS
jgi:hypothetical protein